MQALASLADETFAVVPEGEHGFVVTRATRLMTHTPVAVEIHTALAEFMRMSAKVISPRIRATLRSVTVDAGAHEEWLIEDSASRLF